MRASQHISAALTAHHKWHERLQRAIETGRSDQTPGNVKLDNQCEFGKWLYQETSAKARLSPHYQTVRELHAKYHLEAARVLELALEHHKVQAEQAIGPGSLFSQLSRALSEALMTWHTAEMNETKERDGNIVSTDKMNAILESRARALAKTTEQQTGDMMQLVVFTLAEETYGIATEFVHEVQPLRQVTPVPCTPDFVVGVINIRGSLYSVIDIRSFFGLKRREMTDTTKVILVGAAGLDVGIFVDDVKGAMSIALDEIKPALAASSTAKEEYVQGVTKDMLIILNLEALFRDERIIVREEVA